jgi:transposase
MDFNNLKRYLEVTVLLGFSVALAQGQSPGDVDLSFNPGANDRDASTAAPYGSGVQALRSAKMLHADETEASLAGVGHWLQVTCTSVLSRSCFHAKRGARALEAMGILAGHRGRVMHDSFESYDPYDSYSHGLCTAHHLRDLTLMHGEMGQQWAKDMMALLLHAKKLREDHDARTKRITKDKTALIPNIYRGIIAMGYDVNPEPAVVEGKPGRPKRGKALNLLDRFRDREQEVMGFFPGEDIPFDNKQAELKISGSFRSAEGAAAFADLGSFISTARKAGRSILNTLGRMFDSPDRLAFELVPRTAGT